MLLGKEGADPECHLSWKAQVLPHDPHCWGNLEQVQTLLSTDQSENRVLCPQRALRLVLPWLAPLPPYAARCTGAEHWVCLASDMPVQSHTGKLQPS